MGKKFFSSITILLFCATVAGADDIIHLTFEQAAQLALQDNPDLVSLRKDEDSFKYKANQALSPNNPTAYMNKNDLASPSPKATAASTNYGVNFTLGFPGKAFANSMQYEKQAMSLREKGLSKEIELTLSLSNCYVALSVNEKLTSMLAEELKRTKGILSLIEKKYSMAQAQQVELLNTRLIYANLEHDYLVAQDAKKILNAQFLNLIKRPGSTEFAPVIPDSIEIPELSLSTKTLIDMMHVNNHELKSARYTKESASAMVMLASLSPLPDFQLTGAMNLYRVPTAQPIDGVSRTYTAGIALSIPLFFPINEMNGIHAAIRDRESADLKMESQSLNSAAELESLIVNFQAKQRQLKNLESFVVPAAKISYDLVLKSYSLGKADYIKLNDARESWINSEKSYYQSMLDAGQTFNNITQKVGCDFLHKEGPHSCGKES